MRELPVDVKRDLTTPYYRGWIARYWDQLATGTLGWSVDERKQAFFYLMREMLVDEKVRFYPPEDPLGNKGAFWGASVDEIMDYMLAGWPTNASNDDHAWQTDYFYEYLPAISWLDVNGVFRAS